jgi:antirestriction protein ArdC
MICAHLEIEPAVRVDHAAYVEHSLRVLRTDAKAIVSVASAAQKAFDFLAAFSTPAEATTDQEVAA